MDSNCSRHMTGNHKNLNSLKNSHDGSVVFTDNKKGKIIRVETISNFSKPLVEKVFLVEILRVRLVKLLEQLLSM